MEFHRENFCGLLSLQTITEKTFADRYKTAKFAKVSRSMAILQLFAILNATDK